MAKEVGLIIQDALNKQVKIKWVWLTLRVDLHVDSHIRSHPTGNPILAIHYLLQLWCRGNQLASNLLSRCGLSKRPFMARARTRRAWTCDRTTWGSWPSGTIENPTILGWKGMETGENSRCQGTWPCTNQKPRSSSHMCTLYSILHTIVCINNTAITLYQVRYTS